MKKENLQSGAVSGPLCLTNFCFVSLSGAGCFGEGIESRGEGFKGYVWK